ncbi:MAG TPA: putative porin [Candidatus Methylacidiphilales bacterium]
MKNGWKQWSVVLTTLGLFGASASPAKAGSGDAGTVQSTPHTAVDIGAEPNGSSALLDTLVRKGVLSDQEAEEIGVKLTKDQVTSPNVKFQQALGIKQITLFGDMRLRYEDRTGRAPVGSLAPGSATVLGHNDDEERNRYRYRLRFGFKADLVDDWFAGFRLATNPNNPRSGNVTFGDGGSAGPFGKAKSLIGVDQVYLGWKGADWITLEAGRMPNPLYGTSMVIDDNINFDGISEQLHKKLMDGKLELFGNFVQALYSDSTMDNSVNTGAAFNYSDVFMLAEQVGAKFNFTKDIYVKAAPTVFTYTGTRTAATETWNSAVNGASSATNQPSNFGGPFNGDISDTQSFNGYAGNNSAINNLFVIDLPGEVGFKIAQMPMKVFGDFAVNADADHRADLAAHPGSGWKDGYAYRAGVQVNEAKKKGQWQTQAYWQHTGTYAVDPNLVDADIFDGRTNMEGIVLNVTYNFTDAVSMRLQYANANRIDHAQGLDGLAMGTPGTGQDLNLTAIDHYQLLQADLNWKF